MDTLKEAQFVGIEEPLSESGVVRVLRENYNRETSTLTLEFECLLQTFDEVNRNKRMYPLETGKEILKQAQEKARNRRCVGELDHPVEDDVSRNFTVLMERGAVQFLDFWLDGNELYARAKTLSIAFGPTLAGYIKDGVNVGFSLRSIGKNYDVRRDGVTVVKPPLIFVTYDAVLEPSHVKARITRMSVTEVKKVVEQLTCEGGICLRESANALLNLSSAPYDPYLSALKDWLEADKKF